MALNKRKVLDAARKHAQKGAKAKALKEYNKLLQADPRDAKLLLEVGDAYRRWGQAEEAIAQYGKVAQQYRQDGFDARAVAVFKQILNLDPKHYSAYVSLSELYQRMGLDSEAISALQTAADGYHKEGRKAEALDLLRQMAALDPTNTTSRLKVAELLRQEEMNDEALSEYEAVAAELESQQDRDQLISVQERILELKPDRIEALTGLVRNLMATGALDRAEPLAVRSLNVSADPAQYELLIDLYAQMGDDAKLADATRGLAKLFRDRGDDERARELMQRLPAEEMSSSSRLAVDVSEVAEPDLADEELLDEEPFLDMGSGGAELALDLGSDVEIGMPPGDAVEELVLDNGAPAPSASVAPTPLPEGDPDQLLAEASVYLRYGKREQAIASLRAVIAQEPGHRAALEKLGEAYSDDGQKAAAVNTWLDAAEQVRLSGDAEGLAVLKDRIAALDPAAAEQVGSVEAVASSTAGASPLDVAPQAEMELDLEVEMDLDLDTAIEEVASSETQSGLEFGDSDAEFEIEIDDDSATFDSLLVDEISEADASPNAEIDSSFDGLTPDLSLTDVTEEEEFEFEFDLDDEGEDEIPSPPAFEAVSVSSASSSSAKIDEELEEAEFYIAQDMYDEAEAILERVLALAPNHPSALLRLGEVAAAKGEAPDAALSEAGIEINGEVTSSSDIANLVGADPAEPDFETTARLGDQEEEDGEFEIDVDLADFADDTDLDGDAREDRNETTSTTPQLVLDSPSEDESDSISATTEPMDAAQAHSDSEVLVADPIAPPHAMDPEPSESVPSLPVRPEQPAPQPAYDPEDSFDLREALADVLEEDEDSRSISENETSGVLSTVEDGFESIFSDFKKGVSATLEEGDFDTRYDLGIAYREMGLFEDAIGEFRVCSESPVWRFDSLYLMGLCARDLSRFDDAVNHLEQALALPDIPDERLAGVYFDLSIAHEGAGDAERACSTLRRVIEIEPGFPGADKRLVALESSQPDAPDLGEPGEVFESFDDLFDGDDDEDGDDAIVEAVPVETYESFEDLTSEDASPAGPAPDEDTQSPRKGGRKKISFV